MKLLAFLLGAFMASSLTFDPEEHEGRRRIVGKKKVGGGKGGKNRRKVRR